VNDTLFDPEPYDNGTTRRRKPTSRKPQMPQMLVARPAGYHLVTNRQGVQGFHRTSVPEAAMARNGAVVTLCGIVGRRLGEYPDKVPLCQTCEVVHQNR
jgi:hypothetical protein